MVASTSTELVFLTAGALELALCPSKGGSIARFDFVHADRRTPILRGCPGIPANVLEAASFPLVPFVNRIASGSFTFRDRTICLTPNLAGDASPLHGQGWLSPWEIVSATPREANLRFEHRSGEWPWSYAAWQRFSLDEDGVEVELGCTNLSSEPMPCGLGQHPYFHCTSATRLRTDVEHVWTIDERVLPVEKILASGRFDIRDARVCGLDLDHGFDGWGGSAEISDPAWPFAIHLSSSDANFFQLYSPKQGGIFVAEPVTHANAALNVAESEWAQLGMRVLAPGEGMSLIMRLVVGPPLKPV